MAYLQSPLAFKVYWEHAGCLTLCFIPGSQNNSRFTQDTLSNGLPNHFFFASFTDMCATMCHRRSQKRLSYLHLLCPCKLSKLPFQNWNMFWACWCKKGFVAKKVCPTGFQRSLLICLKSTDKLLYCKPCWWAQDWRGFFGACPSQVTKCTHRSQCWDLHG